MPPVAPTAETFKAGSLDIADLSPSPITQFHAWFSDAQKGTTQPEACTLSTASLPSGSISSRIVYLKELTPTGFVIFSNFQTSRKAVDLASNPQASLLWWWKEVERQVRVEGPTERISKKESQEYFNTRARGSRIGAWASRQSQPIADRSVLENWVKEETERWEGKEVEVPEWWGGLRIKPLRIEFWQGRESRLHDRFVYSRESVDSDEWKVERLSP